MSLTILTTLPQPYSKSDTVTDLMFRIWSIWFEYVLTRLSKPVSHIIFSIFEYSHKDHIQKSVKKMNMVNMVKVECLVANMVNMVKIECLVANMVNMVRDTVRF